MKKLSKAICFTLLLGLICLCFSMTVFAETESGDLGNGFSYTINDDTKTITIEGQGKIPVLNDNPLYNEKWEEYTVLLGDGITDTSNIFFYCSKINFGKNLREEPSVPDTCLYEVSPENPYYSDYHGCLYTKDYKKLIRYPAGKEPNDFHPDLQIIGAGSCGGYFGPDLSKKYTFIIPWGVTTIEDKAFTAPKYNDLVYVIPDTAIHLGVASDNGEHHFSSSPVWVPSRHNLAAWNVWYKGSEQEWHGKTMAYIAGDHVYEAITDIPYNNIASYYNLKPNSLKTFQNGKTYYFDSNYKMLKGWNYADGNWYYFNDYGAAVVKIWLKSGGKWYFMQADGTMAKNKWIQWYNKWYYVGSDGAMYANRYTPDGYWVNASGVWS